MLVSKQKSFNNLVSNLFFVLVVCFKRSINPSFRSMKKKWTQLKEKPILRMGGALNWVRVESELQKIS
jgi:hypothetical protein